MRIGEVARAAGVSPSTIRYYEMVGILPKPIRINGVRRYEADAVDELKILRFCRSGGISIQRLVTIAKHEPGTRARYDVWVDVVKARIVDLEASIRETERTRQMLEQAVACECGGRRKACTVVQAVSV